MCAEGKDVNAVVYIDVRLLQMVLKRWAYMCMLNNCLEWDKWVLNERTYNLSHSRQLFNTLIPPVANGRSVAYTLRWSLSWMHPWS